MGIMGRFVKFTILLLLLSGCGQKEEISIVLDGERKHLHFALYEADEIRLAGYVQSEAELDDWIKPSDFFTSFGQR